MGATPARDAETFKSEAAEEGNLGLVTEEQEDGQQLMGLLSGAEMTAETSQEEEEPQKPQQKPMVGLATWVIVATGLITILTGLIVVIAIWRRGPLVDWGDWEGGPSSTADTAPTGTEDAVGDGATGDRPEREDELGHPRNVSSLQQLVANCVRRLELPGITCGDVISRDEYRVPLMATGDLSCGFEIRMPDAAIADLALKYDMVFIGDSTTRRLAESFVSIFTGRASKHRVVHDFIDMSRGDLKVVFHWAPCCSVDGGIREAVRAVVDAKKSDPRESSSNTRRTVIVTAFGVHDANELRTTAEGSKKHEWYATGLPQDTVSREGITAAALLTCRDATSQLVRVAASSVGAPLVEGAKSRGHEDRVTKLGEERLVGPEVADASCRNSGGGCAQQDPPPLVFLLQNNPYPVGSDEDFFLQQLHEIQEQIVAEAVEKAAGYGRQDGVFVVRDRDSLYQSMSCYRVDDSIHFHEPVKLVEGKMLWHLLGLVDGRKE